MSTTDDAPDASSSMTRRIISNILEWAGELKWASHDLAQMPSRDQAKVWNDLSGDEGRRRTFGPDGTEYFTKDAYEPKDVVINALDDLAYELDKMPAKKKGALEKALQRSPDYVNRSFRLKFLRAESFDARAAAVRMALYFEEKLELFGEEKLTREIYLSDLDEDDMACLRTGYLQILNELDLGNRHVIFMYKALSDCYKQRENLLRSYWYVTNLLSENEDVQKLGVTNVVYNLCKFPEEGMDYEKSRRLARLFRAVPLRMCGFYPCVDTSAWGVVVDTFSFLISKYLRVRLRIIKGDRDEVMMKLKSIGIPSEFLPVDDENGVLVGDHLLWIADQEQKEATESEPAQKRSRAQRDDKTEAMSDLMAHTSTLYETLHKTKAPSNPGSEETLYEAKAPGAGSGPSPFSAIG